MKILLLCGDGLLEECLQNLWHPAKTLADKDPLEAVTIEWDEEAVKQENVSETTEEVVGVYVVKAARKNPFEIALSIKEFVESSGYKIILTGDSETDLWLAGLLSGLLKSPILTEVISIDVGEKIRVTRPAYEESLWQTFEYDKQGYLIISIRSGAFPLCEKHPRVMIKREVKSSFAQEIKGDFSVTSVLEKASPLLRKSRFIVGAGLGIEEPSKLELVKELASLLGGEWGVTRPLVDQGWAPRERMIGHSGERISPLLYIALGISGAPYHMAGVQGARTIVSINKDPGAPIFKYSDYGLVADLREALPKLIFLLKERLS
jgi:electron transfer flavoprotein alpha subunit